jgi:hypothetical protein
MRIAVTDLTKAYPSSGTILGSIYIIWPDGPFKATLSIQTNLVK